MRSATATCLTLSPCRASVAAPLSGGGLILVTEAGGTPRGWVEAEQLAAMGKITEIIGKRAANVTGEVTVEVENSNQQLRTPYAQRDAHHAEAVSFLLFSPEFAKALIELGQQDAQRWVDQPHDLDDLWQITPIQG